MRLAIVQAGLGTGGTERVVSLLAADRCKRGDEIHILAFVHEDEESYFPLHPQVTVHKIAQRHVGAFGNIGFFSTLARLRALRSELRLLKPDMVLSFLTKINIMCLLATTGLGMRVVVSERNNPQVQKQHILWRFLSPLVLGRADRLVMQTEAIASTLPPRLRKKAIVIGNPCDQIALGTEPNGSRLVVAVGRLVAQKDFDTFVAAFARIADLFPDWKAVIFGEGTERSTLQQKIDALGMSERICLPGITNHAGEWVQCASIFVLSSRYEGFPNVLIEAMAAGVPVISTDCDYGPGEIVEPGVSGLLVPIGGVSELAEAMAHMMREDAVRETMGRAARDAVARFSSEAIMGKWNSALSELHR